jgi:hypothetical protein
MRLSRSSFHLFEKQMKRHKIRMISPVAVTNTATHFLPDYESMMTRITVSSTITENEV